MRAWLLPLLLTFVLAGCADPPGEVPVTDTQGRYVIELTLNNTFEPAMARVPVGATVVWVMRSNTTHDVDVYAPVSDYSNYNSFNPPPNGLGRLMYQGDEFAINLDQVGEWRTYCHTHHYQEMRGSIFVN